MLLSTQDHAGYEVIPLVSLEKSAGADPAPQVHVAYIPPVLACDAWAPLQVDLLQSLFDRIGRKIDRLAEQVGSRGITLESHAQGDSLIIAQLRCLTRPTPCSTSWPSRPASTRSRPTTSCAGWSVSCRSSATRAGRPSLPRYDHDDLGGCFYAVRKHLDFLLDRIVEPSYEQRPFQGAGMRMQVALEPKWRDSDYQMYVGVKSRLPEEECKRLLERGGLDMKIGSSEQVDRIFKMGGVGLRFSNTQLNQ